VQQQAKEGEEVPGQEQDDWLPSRTPKYTNSMPNPEL